MEHTASSKISQWRIQNHTILARDLLRDFCAVYAIIMEQEQRFAHSQSISYAVLRELLGEAVSKGVFWRLKDTAHHLFRKSTHGKRSFEGYGMSEDYAIGGHGEEDATHVLESMVDWCVGYAFHECCKLREDAFQLQHYSTRLEQLQKRAPSHAATMEHLLPFTSQTKQSIAREMKRILGVLEQVKELFLTYYATHGNNAAVARFIGSEKTLVEQCFGDAFPAFMQALYGDTPWRLYVLAATHCLEGGHRSMALEFVQQAQNLAAPQEIIQELMANLEPRKGQPAAVV